MIRLSTVDLPPPDAPTSAVILSGREDDVEIVEDGLVVAVGERHVVEPDFARPGDSGLASGASSSFSGRSAISYISRTPTMPFSSETRARASRLAGS